MAREHQPYLILLDLDLPDIGREDVLRRLHSDPLMGRITTVADVFDSLTYERLYEGAWPLDEAIAEIRRQCGERLDPRVVDAFLAIARLTSPD